MPLVGLILGAGFFLLNLVAIHKIITKAGYSGKWILLVLAPFVAYLIGLAILIHDARSRTFHAGSLVAWSAVAGILMFIEYIFFLVFAFSEWPALRPRPQSYLPGYRAGRTASPAPPGTRAEMWRPAAGNRLGADQPRRWPDRPGETPRSETGRWPDPWGRSSDQRPPRRGPQWPATGEPD